MLNKLLIFLIVLYVGVVNAQNINTTKKEIEILVGQTVRLSSNAQSAFNLRAGKSFFTLDNKYPEVFITGKVKGKGIIQILTNSGEFETYSITVIKDPAKHSADRRQLYNGYNIIWKTSIFGMKNYKRQHLRKSSSLLVTTKLGPNAGFKGFVKYTDRFPLQFYVRTDYKNWYYAYGDIPLLQNKYKPQFLNSPFLRQNILGYNYNKKLFVDIWTGELSPIYTQLRNTSQSNITNSNYDRTHRVSQFSGVRVLYKANKNLDFFGTGILIHDKDAYMNYIGSEYRNKNLKTSVSLGQTPEGGNISSRFIYNFKKRGYGLQSINTNYLYVPKGYTNVWFSSSLPMENFNTVISFHNGKTHDPEGTFFAKMGFNYNLFGFQQRKDSNLTFGWRNDKISLSAFGMKGYNEYSYLDRKFDLMNYGVNLSMILNNTGKFKHKISVSNFTGEQENINNQRKNNRTSIRYSVSQKQGFAYALLANRLNNQNSGIIKNRNILGGEVRYRKQNFSAFLRHSVNFTDSSNTSALGGNQLRTTAGMRYSLKHHEFSAGYTQVDEQSGARNYQTFSLNYTLKFGDPNKSILAVFDSNVISGHIYKDSNFNLKYDEGEESLEGMIVIAKGQNKEERGVTNAKGEFKISALPDGTYTLSILDTTNSYTFKGLTENVNLYNNNSYSMSIAAVKTSTTKAKVVSNIEDYVEYIIICDNQRYNRKITKSNMETLISYPVEKRCYLKVELVNQLDREYTIFPSQISLSGNEEKVFSIESSKKIVGQIFKDKNNNRIYDIGEEMEGTVVFDKAVISSNKNGYFSYIVPEDVSLMKFKNVKNKNCSVDNPNIVNFSGKKILMVICK